MVIAFFDPVCRDNKDAWPSLKQALTLQFPRLPRRSSLAFALSISFLISYFFFFFVKSFNFLCLIYLTSS
ncbi:hypothetical protein Patl1_37314 [Pistacia atlantica]|nr:hypothetical protein Patl1_37314 [Pistacia atlantica]